MGTAVCIALLEQYLKPDPIKKSQLDLHQFMLTNTTPDDSLIIVDDFNTELGVGHLGTHNIIPKHNLIYIFKAQDMG